MNELKYKILKLLDTSNETFTGFEIIKHFQDLEYDINDIEKHFFDLRHLGYTDNGTHQGVTHITVYGRKYIDDYEYREKHDNLYITQLKDAKASAKFSQRVSIVSVIIAACAVAANIVTAVLLN